MHFSGSTLGSFCPGVHRYPHDCGADKSKQCPARVPDVNEVSYCRELLHAGMSIVSAITVNNSTPMEKEILSMG
jgi:hypothetical protein